MLKKEQETGVKYQDVQRAHAEEIMGEALHTTVSERQDDNAKQSDAKIPGGRNREDLIDSKRKFQDRKDTLPTIDTIDTIAEDAMLNGGKVSEEQWDGDPESEKDNFVQEELYIHAKLLIVDDRIAICGSSNLNDRVS